MERNTPILVTGGAGFIGSNFVLEWLAEERSPVVNLDRLTYAGNPANLETVLANPAHIFVEGDVRDRSLVGALLREHKPRAVIHFAAESHVDRSIAGPESFVETNIGGTLALLEEVRKFLSEGGAERRRQFRFLHVSTDEVFGTLAPDEPAFRETTAYAPNSPYAASKAGSDHLVRAWHHTFGLPTLVSNCSNNYGPFQFPEKLIPLMIAEALAGHTLPVYGDGQQVRDWLYVGDHTRALRTILAEGRVGETYAVGGGNQVTNLELVQQLCALLDELVPASSHKPHAQLIRFVADRPGHDRRYAIDASKLRAELGWEPRCGLAEGLRATVEWYLAHAAWMEAVRSGAYREWLKKNYAHRGLAEAVPAAELQAGGGRR